MPPKTKPTNPLASEIIDLRTVEAWFARIEYASIRLPSAASKKNAPTARIDLGNASLANQFISRFGLQNAQDVTVFWRTAAGKATKAMIVDRLVALEALKIRSGRTITETRLKQERFLAFLLLGLMYKRDAKAQNVKELIEQQNKKQSQQYQKQKAVNAKLKDDRAQTPEVTLAYYAEMEDALRQTLEEKTDLLKRLIHTFEHQLPQQKQRIDERYDLFKNYLDELNDITDEVNRFLQSVDPDKSFNLEHFEEQILKLEETIKQDAERIGAFLEEGTEQADLEAQALLAETNAKNLKVTALKDMRSVIQGEKLLYNLHGERTHSLSEAKFILTKDLQIAKEGEQFYLLPTTQSLDWLTPEAKRLAQQNFERHQPEMMEIRDMVQMNRQVETDWHENQCKACLAEQELFREQVQALKEQIEKVHLDRSQLEATLSQKPPVLSPISSPSSKLNDSYTQIIRAHEQEGFPQPVIDGFKQRLTHLKDKGLSETMNQLDAHHNLNPEMIATLLSSDIPEDAKSYLVQEMEHRMPAPSSRQPKPSS